MSCMILSSRLLQNERLPVLQLMSGEQVSEVLGKPCYWEGYSLKPADDSDVWRYGNLQIVFGEGSVCAIIVLFEALHAIGGNSPLDRFVTELDSTTTLDDFVGFLQRNRITYQEGSDVTRKPILRMPGGVVAWFSRRTDHERSVVERRPIRSEHLYLMSIRIGENQLLGSDI